MPKSIFIGATSSNAGKSWMATAVCAWLRSKGLSVAPFKAQNMSNHSFPCRGGGEIGRAQVVQAEACGIEPEPAMNPILLKPNGDGTSQVIVNGHVWQTMPARGYYEHRDTLMQEVLDAYATLARRFDAIVIEGAGSVSELNLRAYDVVNLGLVTRIQAPWVLVSDIERGGVFGSILGTVGLLTAEERALFRGFMINKFHGDRTLFEDGVRILEERSEAPCLGVFPYAEEIAIAAEDSLAVHTAARTAAPPGARIAIDKLPCLSNATDFRLLTWADWITAVPRDDYDFVILPGTKHTLGDLEWLRARGLDAWIRGQHERGATVIGICGGFQMLGRTIKDPGRIESALEHAPGLGLLPADTVMAETKITRAVRGATMRGTRFTAYEIHLGITRMEGGVAPFATLEDGLDDGACGERVIGTYLHGLLEEPAICRELFGVDLEATAAWNQRYYSLAAWFERHACHLDALGFGVL